MKKIVFIISFLPFIVTAQSFKAGLNVANMTLGESPYESSKALIRPEIGFVSGRSSINNNLNIHMECLISWRGMNYSYNKTVKNDFNSLTYIINTNYKVKLTYLEVPVILDMDLGPVLVEFGPSISFRAGGKRVGETTIIKDYVTIPDEVVKISETGRYANNAIFPKGVNAKSPVSFVDLGMNLGVQYPLSEKLMLNARYYYGFTDVFRKNYPTLNASQTQQANTVLKLSLGIMLD